MQHCPHHVLTGLSHGACIAVWISVTSSVFGTLRCNLVQPSCTPHTYVLYIMYTITITTHYLRCYMYPCIRINISVADSGSHVTTTTICELGIIVNAQIHYYLTQLEQWLPSLGSRQHCFDKMCKHMQVFQGFHSRQHPLCLWYVL